MKTATPSLSFTAHFEMIETPLGSMMGVGSEDQLYLLEFADQPTLQKQLAQLQSEKGLILKPGSSSTTSSIREELNAYFRGELKAFNTPIASQGSSFQQSVMRTLVSIPFGTCWSYSRQAQKLGSPQAIRAVARANGRNRLVIVVPCHRVIGKDGSLTGYAGGLARKKWLLEHEQKHSHQ